jgi:hypothetical protein
VSEKKYRAIPLSEILSRFSPEKQAEIRAGADAIIAKERSRRKIRDLTATIQSHLPAEVAAEAPAVDRYLKALRRLVRKAGGELDLILRLPGQPSVRLHEVVDPEIRFGARKVEAAAPSEPEPVEAKAEA